MAPGHRHASWSYSLDRPRRADARRSWRARSTTRGNLESSLAERHRRRRVPVHHGRPERDAGDPRPGRPHAGRARRALQGGPRRHRSPASASTRRRRTPAPTSATSGSANGTLLARGTFTRRDRRSGWQQLTFSTPVDITAGTTYVASYYAPRGHYSASSAYFFMPSPTGGNTLDSPPLHALSANSGGANGVYTYAGATTFPTSTYNGENYAVDVVFTPKLPPGPVSSVTATAGAGLGDRQLHARRSPAARRRATSSRRSSARRRSPRSRVTGSPPATSVKVSGLDPRHRVHVQGAGRQRQRHRPAVGAVERGHADRCRPPRRARPG